MTYHNIRIFPHVTTQPIGQIHNSVLFCFLLSSVIIIMVSFNFFSAADTYCYFTAKIVGLPSPLREVLKHLLRAHVSCIEVDLWPVFQQIILEYSCNYDFQQLRFLTPQSSNRYLLKFPLNFLVYFMTQPCILLPSLCFGSTCTPLTLLQLRYIL